MPPKPAPASDEKESQDLEWLENSWGGVEGEGPGRGGMCRGEAPGRESQ